MGKIVSSTFVSLDGVINHMDRWHFDFINAESDAIALRQLKDSQGLLMGRRTYEIYAQAWPGRDGEYADRIDATAKYVASTTLQNPAWTNTAVLDGDLVEAVTKLKQDPGRNLLTHGYGPVARTLLRHGLLDELILWVHPMLAGVGTTGDMIFTEDLKRSVMTAVLLALFSAAGYGLSDFPGGLLSRKGSAWFPGSSPPRTPSFPRSVSGRRLLARTGNTSRPAGPAG